MSNIPSEAVSVSISEITERKQRIPFNVPFNNQQVFNKMLPEDAGGSELFRGRYAARVCQYFKENYQCAEVVPTASCTNALELAALLLQLQPEDEVILPAYTYVSTANAFELRGAKLVLCDSSGDSPNLDLSQLEALITPKTRAIVVIHYGGVSVDMYRLQDIARRHRLVLIEDAAHAIDAYFDGLRLGTFGDLATFSFHETKNITCGQGGVLLVNNPEFADRVRILRDCGTNRHNFFLGLVDKYCWIDVGSVFNLSELNCAYLYPQLEHIGQITAKRLQLWNNYYHALAPLEQRGCFKLPLVGPRSRHNAHIFFILLRSREQRDQLLKYLNANGVVATFHYSGLHQCPYYQNKYPEKELPNAEMYSERLLRLPLYYDLSLEEQALVLGNIAIFFEQFRHAIPAEPLPLPVQYTATTDLPRKGI
ncbi:MAG: dTDP-4-amino-4,6-dideoxygalactose transaminase [Saprospiraceae bacterium]|nr:dTDP-4-amino-4,6-dideoxygalactose transaminase [Saprospiraceae bacterium]